MHKYFFSILTLCCVFDRLSFDPRLFDPMSIDPRLFDPMSIDPRLFDPMSIDPRLFDPMSELSWEVFKNSSFKLPSYLIFIVFLIYHLRMKQIKFYVYIGRVKTLIK